MEFNNLFLNLLISFYYVLLVFSPSANSLYSSNMINIAQITLLSPRDSKFNYLRMHFPDWDERAEFEARQKKIYYSSYLRYREAKRTRVEKSFKYSLEEQDAINYFEGKGFYADKQNLATPYNRYDTRETFLLKMANNPEMRNKFLETYNRVNNIIITD